MTEQEPQRHDPKARAFKDGFVSGLFTAGMYDAGSLLAGGGIDKLRSLEFGSVASVLVFSQSLAFDSWNRATNEVLSGEKIGIKHELIGSAEAIVGGATAGALTGLAVNPDIRSVFFGAGMGAYVTTVEAARHLRYLKQAKREAENQNRSSEQITLDLSSTIEILKERAITPIEGWPRQIEGNPTAIFFGVSSLAVMKGFRDQLTQTLPQLELQKRAQKASKDPCRVSQDGISMLFLLPKVTHHHAFDPSARKDLATSTTDKSALTLKDSTGSIIVNPIRKSPSQFFPGNSVFKTENDKFDREKWEDFKRLYWETPAIVLAQFQKEKGKIVDKYWLANSFGQTDMDIDWDDKDDTDDSDDDSEEETEAMPETSPLWRPPRLTYNSALDTLKD